MKKLTAFILLSFIFSSLIIGQDKKPFETKPDEAKPAVSGKPEMTATDVEAFLDGIVPTQISQNDIGGMTIAVVKDGKLLFTKGYGYSDVKTKNHTAQILK